MMAAASAAMTAAAQTIETPGVHLGPGGIVVRKSGHTTVIKNDGISDARGQSRRSSSAGSPAGRTLPISASGQTRTYLCTQTTLELTGSRNHLTLQGTCAAIQISGSHNRVRVVGTVGRVELTGSGNVVTWTKQSPQGTPIEDSGPNNSAVFKP